MAKKFVEAKYDDGKHIVKVGLTLILWTEDSVHFQYSPQLDLTGYGKSANEAQSSFEQTLKEFINYTVNKDTLFDELERLGWTTNKRKKRVRAPEEEQLLEDNETYKDLSNMPGITRSTTNFALPL
jgi:hypothetical protein